MNHFVGDDVDRIKIGKEDWVDIKSKMTYGDQQKVLASYAPATITQGKPELGLDFEGGNLTLLQINIKAWSFKDAENHIVEITRPAIERLTIEVGTILAEEIAKRNPPPKALR